MGNKYLLSSFKRFVNWKSVQMLIPRAEPHIVEICIFFPSSIQALVRFVFRCPVQITIRGQTRLVPLSERLSQHRKSWSCQEIKPKERSGFRRRAKLHHTRRDGPHPRSDHHLQSCPRLLLSSKTKLRATNRNRDEYAHDWDCSRSIQSPASEVREMLDCLLKLVFVQAEEQS